MNRLPSLLRTLTVSLLALAAPTPSFGAAAGEDPGVPGPLPADCTSQCEATLQKLLSPCVLADGTVDLDCAAKVEAAFDMDRCVRECDAQNGGVDPVIAACHAQCYEDYASGLANCSSPDGGLNAECVAAKDVAFTACVSACGELPWLPNLAACVASCTPAYQESIETCRVNGGIDLDCFKEKRKIYDGCLQACGIALSPLEDLCLRRCEAAYQAALERCAVLVDPNGVVEPDAFGKDCYLQAQTAFDACLVGCGITIPDEIGCATECDFTLKTKLAECNGDANCEKAALDSYTACLEACGLIVPPIPEPDPCVANCDLLYSEAVSSCFKQETGEVDEACLRQADETYLACLKDCGVILPDVPPGGDLPCASACELAYKDELSLCFAAGANGVADGDDACAAAADAKLLECLQGCGVDPGPLPGDVGFPVGECEQSCGIDVLGVLFDCAAQGNGVVSPECLAKIGEAFNGCLEACGDRAEERALAALARTASNRPFQRGDVDANASLQITDAVQVLSYLFLGSGPLDCDDAADANDDGTVNISDASAILGFLFLGASALPAPFETAGADPTPDTLGCDKR